MLNMFAAGKLVSVRELSNTNGIKVYSITVGVKNTYKEKSGEYAGTHGRTFVNAKFFADTENKVNFIENTVKPLVAGKEDKEFTPVSMDVQFRNNNYGNADNKVYSDEFVVQQFTPYL